MLVGEYLGESEDLAAMKRLEKIWVTDSAAGSLSKESVLSLYQGWKRLKCELSSSSYLPPLFKLGIHFLAVTVHAVGLYMPTI